jgi:hypothetical protein
VLVRYGDQWEALNFSDLIDINNPGVQEEVSSAPGDDRAARSRKVVYVPECGRDPGGVEQR